MNAFDQKKASILAQIEATDEANPDASPKGTIDEPIIPLIRLINAHPDMVTTSSCSGRVSVFLEGVKLKNEEAKLGGKGDGGRWLFITHDPKELENSQWWHEAKQHTDDHDCSGPSRFVIYKFEAMILHVKCRDAKTAGDLYTEAMACGFRESGIGTNNVVGIRISLRLDVPIAHLASDGSVVPLVSDDYISALNSISLDLFDKNFAKMRALGERIKGMGSSQTTTTVSETKEERRERKRREGLARQAALAATVE